MDKVQRNKFTSVRLNEVQPIKQTRPILWALLVVLFPYKDDSSESGCVSVSRRKEGKIFVRICKRSTENLRNVSDIYGFDMYCSDNRVVIRAYCDSRGYGSGPHEDSSFMKHDAVVLDL